VAAEKGGGGKGVRSGVGGGSGGDDSIRGGGGGILGGWRLEGKSRGLLEEWGGVGVRLWPRRKRRLLYPYFLH